MARNRARKDLGSLAIASRDERAFACAIEAIKEEEGKWQLLSDRCHILAAAQPAHRNLKGMGPPIGPERDSFALQQNVFNWQSSCPLDDFRQAVGDILKLSREDANFVALTVYLNAGAIELEFKGSFTHAIQSFGRVLSAVGQHRRNWRQQPKTEIGQACSPCSKAARAISPMFPENMNAWRTSACGRLAALAIASSSRPSNAP